MKSLLTLAVLLLSAAAADAKDYLMYVGTYTNNNSQSKGIYAYRFDSATGAVTPLGVAAETPNPSFLAMHPNNKYLYSVSELSNFNGQRAGAVSAFAVDAQTGKLKLLNTVATKGSGPCHLIVDKTGKTLAVANYNTGSTNTFAIKEDGSLSEVVSFIQHEGAGPMASRQKGPHAHSVNIPKDNRFVLVTDLGLDKVLVYKLDAAKSTITPNDPPSASVPPSSGPRHLAWHPSYKFAYVINEMGNSMTAFRYDAAHGVLNPIETVSTLPKDFTGHSDCAEVFVHPTGKFVYGSNRGHDSIAVFSINGSSGKLTPIEFVSTQGKTPRNFNLDPTGSYLLAANQQTNDVVEFRIDRATGKLTPTGTKFQVGAPVCIIFSPAK